MLIGKRLRKLQEEKKLSQGDIEKRPGLLRRWKFLYIHLCYEGKKPPNLTESAQAEVS
jgi:hypothetical protein